MAQRNGDFSQTFDAQGRLIVIYDPLTGVRQANGQMSCGRRSPNNRIPLDRMNAVALNVLRQLSASRIRRATRVTGANNYATTANQTTESNNYSARVDHNLTSAHRIYGRFSFQRSDQQTAARWPGPSAPDSRTVIDRYYHVVLGDTLVLSPSLTRRPEGRLRARACQSGLAGLRSRVARLPGVVQRHRAGALSDLQRQRRQPDRQRRSSTISRATRIRWWGRSTSRPAAISSRRASTTARCSSTRSRTTTPPDRFPSRAA